MQQLLQMEIVAMTNKERQASLDKKKWIESKQSGIDMSGRRLYCSHCEFQDSNISHHYKCIITYCKATQEERERNSLCAKAYNRMQRK